MINASQDDFRHSAQTKKDAACELVRGKHRHPGPAVYLAHVALECAFKLRILRHYRTRHTSGLRRILPEQSFSELFAGAKGHDLHHLARTASIARYLIALGEPDLLKQPEWQAMGGGRPYSLRYGIERVSAAEVKRQVELTERLTNLVLDTVK